MGFQSFTVIADDLTGAADSGVQLVRAGYSAAVFFQGEPVAEAEDTGNESEAVVLDTDSRALSGAEARERVLEAVNAVNAVETAGQREFLYKKVDSALRGNIAVEIEAALEATGREWAAIAPAFPSEGRTTVGGVQHLNGRPVHLTELARDTKTPVDESHLPSLLASLGPVSTVGAGDLRDGHSLAQAFEVGRCVVVDAEDDLDLSTLVHTIEDPSSVLWVGSAGLSRALGAVYPGTGSTTETAGEKARNALVVVGSLSRVSRDQVAEIEEEGEAVTVELAGEPGKEDFTTDEIEATIAKVGEVLSRGSNVVLQTAAEPAKNSPEFVAGGLAKVLAGLEAESFEALVLTGGDTAISVARAIGATGIRLSGEIEPGVPVGRLVGPRPYPVVTKSGGFGGRGTLRNALLTLTQGKEASQ